MLRILDSSNLRFLSFQNIVKAWFINDFKSPFASRRNKDIKEFCITTISPLSSVCKSCDKTSAIFGKNSFISRHRLGKSLMACLRMSTLSSSHKSSMASNESFAKVGNLEKNLEVNWDANFLVLLSPRTPLRIVLNCSSY